MLEVVPDWCPAQLRAGVQGLLLHYGGWCCAAALELPATWLLCKLASSILFSVADAVLCSLDPVKHHTLGLRWPCRYTNTTACISKICFIDGAKGILRYRGYPIEQLAEKANFSEVTSPASDFATLEVCDAHAQPAANSAELLPASVQLPLLVDQSREQGVRCPPKAPVCQQRLARRVCQQVLLPCPAARSTPAADLRHMSIDSSHIHAVDSAHCLI